MQGYCLLPPAELWTDLFQWWTNLEEQYPHIAGMVPVVQAASSKSLQLYWQHIYIVLVDWMLKE